MSIQLLTFSSASTSSVGPDPYLTSVTLLLSGDDLVDHSSSPKTVTNYGNVAVSTTTKKYGTGSIYFNGATLTSMKLGSGSATEFIDTSSDFTVECWIYPTVAVAGESHIWHINPLTGSYQTGCGLTFDQGRIFAMINGYSLRIDSGVTFSINTWYHIAYVRYGSIITIYINGISKGSSTSTIAAGSYFYLVVGNDISGQSWDATYPFTGYIDDFRITKGVARYTSNFYPPVASLLTVGNTYAPRSVTAPDTPTNVSATAMTLSAYVSFTLPLYDGGSTITSYVVKAYTNNSYTNISSSGISSPITISGLSNNIPYTFTVTAVNGAGSTESSQSNSLTLVASAVTSGVIARLNGDDLLDHSGNGYSIATYGSPSVSTTIKKFGTGSIYFDTSSYVALPTVPNFALGTGNFTIECWVYIPASTSHTYQRVFWIEAGGTVSNSGLAPELYSGTTSQFTLNTGGGQIVGVSLPARATWVHLAAVRVSSTTNFYVNGVSQGTANDTTNYTCIVSGPLVGTAYYSGSLMTTHLGGYVDDFRITKGTAVYTSNFTPPTSVLTN